MSRTLPITNKLHVTPLFDIRHHHIEAAYREGLITQLHDNASPVPVSSFVTDLQRAIAVQGFSGHPLAFARHFVGYRFGSLHGTILTTTGALRRDVATLAMLDTTNAQHGYLAGRYWFFHEADPYERRFTDDYLIKQLHEMADECTAWHDPDEVWQYAIATLIGELSEPIFSVTHKEQASWDVEERDALAWLAQHDTRARSNR